MCHRKSGWPGPPTTWLTVALLLVVQVASAQSKADRALHSVGPDAEAVCVLAPIQKDSGVRNVIDPGRRPKTVVQMSRMPVTFVDEDPADPWPAAAKAAFSYATGIWESTIVSPMEIRVNAYWADRGGCSNAPVTLGSAGPRALHRDHPALPLSDTWYVDALADALSGLDMGGTTEPDIRVFLNRDCDDPSASTRWYFGMDGNPPAGQIDFVSVVLHELGHGLGISGAGRVTSGSGTVRYSTRPYAYDRFTIDGTMPSSPLLAYPDFSAELGSALQSGSGGVLYEGSRAVAANRGVAPSLYAPNPWRAGSSYSHLDEQTYNGTSNALMTPVLSTMEANHVIGPVTCGLLEDMGWTVAAGNCDISLPVELAGFQALVRGDDVLLRWRTVSETENSGFEIEHRRQDGDFESVQFVAGAGSSASEIDYETTVADLEWGRHEFRLRQIDFGGRFTFSETVEATIASAGRFELSAPYPNPFNPSTQLTLAVDRTQLVRVYVLDMLGRTVATLLDSVLPEGERASLRFDGTQLPSGIYVIRASGESFSTSRSAVLLR